MRILLDENLPVDLPKTISKLGRECQTVRGAGYGAKKNGELLVLAENHRDILLTTDRQIHYQQNMTGRSLSIIILRAKSNRLANLLPLVP
jgi:predicted nuclease of predicted toxin-antitoxin system